MSKRALVCGLMPEFGHDSGSRVLYDVMTMLQELGYAVSLLTDHSAYETRYTALLQQRGIAVYIGMDEWLERLLTVTHFDLALFALWFMAEPYIATVRRLSPATRVIVHSIDLHFVRNARKVYSAVGEPGAVGELDAKYGDEMRRELNTYAAADLVLTVSDKEAALVEDLVARRGLTATLPDSSDIPLSPWPAAARRGILLIGYFKHLPNRDAAQFLLGEIYPALDPRILEEHPIQVVGAGAQEHAGDLAAGKEGVRIIDWVPSLLPYLHRARITVIPLRYGAGTKGKLVQALMAGTPSVSTTIGVEGLDLEHGRHVLVADTAADFAVAMTRLLGDEPLWNDIARQGRAHIAPQHSRAAARERLAQAITRIEG